MTSTPKQLSCLAQTAHASVGRSLKSGGANRARTIYRLGFAVGRLSECQWFVSHSSESPSSVFPPFKETTALPSCQNSTRSRPAGHANSAAAAAPTSPGKLEGGINPRIASSRGQSRRSRLSIASPNLTTLRARDRERKHQSEVGW